MPNILFYNKYTLQFASYMLLLKTQNNIVIIICLFLNIRVKIFKKNMVTYLNVKRFLYIKLTLIYHTKFYIMLCVIIKRI